MGKWRWEGMTKDGKRVNGTTDGSDEKEIRRTLRMQGVRVTRLFAPSILEADLSAWLVEHGIGTAFTNKDLGRFTKQLAILINAGIPILQGLEIIYKQEKNPVLKKAVKGIAESVAGGKTLAESMMKQNVFTKLYCNLVKAGEAGGILDGVLNKLSIYMEKQEKTKSQIKSALTYPAIVVVVGVLVVTGLMIFVVPKFVDMLNQSGQEIPAVTQFVINISEFIQNYGLVILPFLIIGIVVFKRVIKTPQGKIGWDRFTMNMPIFGGVVIKGNLASFTRTLSTMISSGVPLIDSLDICIETIDNTVIAKDIGKVKAAIVEGKTMAEPLTRIKYFPEMVAQMVKVGEATGRTDEMLLKVSELFENEVEELIGNATKLIEPIILVGLGGVVAVVLIAMYLPIFMSAGGAGH